MSGDGSGDGSGDVALDELLEAASVRRPYAVLDRAWPQRLRERAQRQVDLAVTEGRVGAGDLVLFTSGSTGHPRAVVRTLRSWEASVQPLSDLTGIGPGDVVWVPGPLSSTLFLYGAWHAVQVGARAVVQRQPPETATALHAVPAMLESALEAADAGLLPAMRTAVVAGDVLPERLRARVAARGWRLLEYYGAAELSFVGWRADHTPFQAFPGAEVAVHGGTMWVRSPYLARGYLEPDGGGPLRHDGDWATVGDLAEEVPGGFRLLGRGDAAVTTGGSTVVVEEVEAAIREAGVVADVAVIGLPHPRLGAAVTAVVVLQEGVARADLIAAVRGLPRPARPLRWLAVPALPRSASGKRDQSAIRELVLSGSARPVADTVASRGPDGES